MHDEDRCGLEALRAGVRGYVLKRQAAADLVRVIREVAAGRVSPGSGRRLRRPSGPAVRYPGRA